MFNIINNAACTLSLQFIEDKVLVYGDVRTFNKATYRDSVEQWAASLEALKEEGYTELYSQIKKEQTNILKFEQRMGFKICGETETELLLVKEL